MLGMIFLLPIYTLFSMEIFIFLIVLVVYIRYEPSIDFAGDKIILWYNEGSGVNKKRVYKILFGK